MSDTMRNGGANETVGVSGTNWERQTLQKILLEHIYEQRRTRRWSIFFKFLFVFFVIILLILGTTLLNKELPQPVMTSQAHTAIIDIRGEINDEQANSADNIHNSLKTVFENKHAKGLILRINSPGGSPVEARHIYDDIFYFKTKNPNVKVYAVIEDTGTSAAYLIASGADAIYADKTSLVGSIGVRLDSFGFVEGMHKIGVERRLFVAGKYKGGLDPYLPRDPEVDAFVKKTLQTVHEAFIENVKHGRGNRLKENDELFTGRFWCGEEALELGLIDGYGDAYYVAREIIKAENIVDYSPSTNLLDRLANRLGASVASALAAVRLH